MGNLEHMGFNAADVEPAGEFKPIPDGLYPAVITDANYKANKAGTGHLLEFTFEVVDGDHKGRQLRSWINTDNPNQKAVEIGKGEFSALCRAVDIITPKDTLEFVNKALNIKVGTKPNRDGDGFSNVIKAYEETGNYQMPSGMALPARNTRDDPKDDLPF